VQCLYEDLIVSVVAKHAAGTIDPAAERGFRDNAAVPDRLYQVIFADDSITITHQVNDQIEHLRLDMHRFTSFAEFVLARINFELSKTIFHYSLD